MCREGTEKEELIASIQEWIDVGIVTRQEKVLGLVGPPGVGKTELLRHLCSQGVLEGNNRVGAAHFFKHSDKQASNLRNCLYSIAKQLRHSIAGLSTFDEEGANDVDDNLRLFRTLLCAPLLNVQRNPQEVILVLLDGVDEADDRDAAVQVVAEVWEKEMPSWLGLVFSSRYRFCCHIKQLTLSYSSDRNQMKLAHFVQSKCRTLLGLSGYELEETIRFIIKESSDFFPFASELVDALLRKKNDNSNMVLKLSDLCTVAARGGFCDVLFKDYCARFLGGPLKGNRDLYQRFLSVVSVSRFLLNCNTLAQVLRDIDVDAVFYLAQEIFCVDENGHGSGGATLTFPHESMRGFLLNRTRAGRDHSISQRLGHSYLADFLMKDRTSELALQHLVYHLCACEAWERVREHVLDFDWLYALVSLPGAAEQLVHDLNTSYSYHDFADTHVTDIMLAIQLGLDRLEKDPACLAFELFGRIEDRTNPVLMSYWRSNFASRSMGIFLPSSVCLSPVGPTFEKFRIKGRFGHPPPRITVGESECVDPTSETASMSINSIAIDGNIGVAGSLDGIVSVLDLRTGACLHMLEGHSEEVLSVAIVGNIVVSGSRDETVRVWDWPTGICLVVLREQFSVSKLAINGDVVVSGCLEVVRIWDWRTGACLHLLEGRNSCIATALAIDSDVVVFGSFHATVTVWERQTMECLHVLEGHSDDIKSVAVQMDVIISGSRDMTVRVWHKRIGNCLCILRGHVQEITTVAIDGDKIVSGSFDRTIRVWDRQTGSCSVELRSHSMKQVKSVAIKGDIVLSASADVASVWDVSLSQKTAGKVTPTVFPLVAAFSHCGSAIVSGFSNGSMQVIDSRTMVTQFALQGSSASEIILAVAFLPERSDCCLAVFNSGVVRIWVTGTGETVQEFQVLSPTKKKTKRWFRRVSSRLEGHSQDVTCAFVDRNVLVTGSIDQTVRLWNFENGTCFTVLKGHQDLVVAVAIDTQVGAVVSASREDFRVWDQTTGACKHVLGQDWYQVSAVAVKGDVAVAGCMDGTLCIIDWAEGNVLWRGLGHTLFSVGSFAIWNDTIWCVSAKTISEWTKGSNGEYVSQVIAMLDSADITSLAVHQKESILHLVAAGASSSTLFHFHKRM